MDVLPPSAGDLTLQAWRQAVAKGDLDELRLKIDTHEDRTTLPGILAVILEDAADAGQQACVQLLTTALMGVERSMGLAKGSSRHLVCQALRTAALRGNVEGVQALLPYWKGSPDHPPIHRALVPAIRFGHLEVVKVLLADALEEDKIDTLFLIMRRHPHWVNELWPHPAPEQALKYCMAKKNWDRVDELSVSEWVSIDAAAACLAAAPAHGEVPRLRAKVEAHRLRQGLDSQSPLTASRSRRL